MKKPIRNFYKNFRRLNWFKWFLSIFSATDDIPYTAEEFVSQARGSKQYKLIRNILIGFWIYLLGLLISSIYFFVNTDTVFNVTANTEIIEISPYDGTQYPDWAIQDAIVTDDESDEELDFSGTITIHKDSRIIVQRIAQNELYIIIESIENSSSKLFFESGEVRELGNSVLIALDVSDKPITLPIDGNITLGKNVREGLASFPVLLNGVVSISDKALVSREYYSTEPHQLKMGDVFEIKKPKTQSSGFIRIQENHGLSLTYSGKGEAGVISRYKSEPILMQNNIWSKLSHDDSLVLFWISLLVIYAGIKIIIRINLGEEKTKKSER